jgi:hypothetical protein
MPADDVPPAGEHGLEMENARQARFDDEDAEEDALDAYEAGLSGGNALHNPNRNEPEDEDEDENEPQNGMEIDPMLPPEHQVLPDLLPPPPPPPPPPRQEHRHTVHFGGRAGEPLDPTVGPGSRYTAYQSAFSVNEDGATPYHPFGSKLEWDLAHWAKTHNVGATVLTDLLQIEGVSWLLGKNCTTY